MRNCRRILFLLVFALGCIVPAASLSLSLDSIREWGRFPRFCVDTYRWGSEFFNGYDTAYVKGTGYKFNVRLRADNWLDFYNFELPDNMRMRMLSDPSTTAGVQLQYMAVSVGYDKNLSHFFGASSKVKQQYSFGFDCSLFGVNLYYIDNNVGTNIIRFGPKHHLQHIDISFDGLHARSVGVDAYYFFNHKKYSQGAAFGFSRVQQRSQGSAFAGFSFQNQHFDFDFSSLPAEMKESLPPSWLDYRYMANTKTYAVKFGYGYNWVFAPHWALCVSESPTMGLRHGYINNLDEKKTSVALYNQLRMSVVWNNRQWFAGAVGDINVGIFYDRDNAFENATMSVFMCLGYRFNLW